VMKNIVPGIDVQRDLLFPPAPLERAGRYNQGRPWTLAED
jgi:hypothetical protein